MRLSAHEALARVADPGSIEPWDGQSHAEPPDPESVVTGELRVGGVPAVAIAWEFDHLGGSVGVRTAGMIVAAIRRATARRMPLLALPRSGGTRMQEGAPAFVQMVAIAGALAEHRRHGLPFLVHQCDPTTGGVLATLGSAGDLTTAEPGAMVGFLGPRAYRAITGEDFPAGVQTAENLLRCGLLDAVVPWSELAQRWGALLRLWRDRPTGSDREPGARRGTEPGARRGTEPAAPRVAVPAAPRVAVPGAPRVAVPGAPEDAEHLWRYVQASRAHDRPDAAQLVAAHMTESVVLPGTSAGDVAGGALVVLGRLGGVPVVLAATEDRWTGEPLTVGGLRTIRRGIDLAGRWGLPVVTVVDTLGAQLSVEGEQSGIAKEISRLMGDLVATPSPSVALLLGAGTGGAALAMLASDRIVAGSHTWVAPLAPEGAAAIRHGGTHDPAQIAWEQRIGAHALADVGFVDVLVRESEPGWLATAVAEVLGQVGAVLAGDDPQRRMERFAAWGSGGTGDVPALAAGARHG